MPVSGVRADSCGSRPSLELVMAVLWIPSPYAPRNNDLLPLWQFQTFSWTPYWLAVVHLPPSGCVHTANPNPLPGIWAPKPEPQLPSPTCLGGWADKPLRLVSAGQHQSSVQESLHFALCTTVAALSFVAPMLPPPQAPSPPVKGLPSVWKHFLLHSSLPEVQVPSLFFCLCFFFCPTQVCGEFLAFWEVWDLLPAFSKCSVGVVPHADVFLMYLWGGRWSPCLTPLPSWMSSP